MTTANLAVLDEAIAVRVTPEFDEVYEGYSERSIGPRYESRATQQTPRTCCKTCFYVC